MMRNHPMLLKRLRRVIPIAALVSVVTTLLSCVIITKVKHVYVSGLVWPFFSDMGRDPPAYYVFCVGLTIVAVLLSITWVFNYQFQRGILQQTHAEIPTKWFRIARFCCTAALLSSIGLPVLAILDTSTYTLIHLMAAYWFFAWQVAAVSTNTYLSKKLYLLAQQTDQTSGYVSMDPTKPVEDNQNLTLKRLRTLKVQRTFMILFFIAFMVYIPLGLIFYGYSPRLTIQECLERNLGVEYCTTTMRMNDRDTKLFNSEKNFARAQSRACGQLGCILTLLGYTLSFLTHDYSEIDHSDNANEVA